MAKCHIHTDRAKMTKKGTYDLRSSNFSPSICEWKSTTTATHTHVLHNCTWNNKERGRMVILLSGVWLVKSTCVHDWKTFQWFIFTLKVRIWHLPFKGLPEDHRACLYPLLYKPIELCDLPDGGQNTTVDEANIRLFLSIKKISPYIFFKKYVFTTILGENSYLTRFYLVERIIRNKHGRLILGNWYIIFWLEQELNTTYIPV